VLNVPETFMFHCDLAFLCDVAVMSINLLWLVIRPVHIHKSSVANKQTCRAMISMGPIPYEHMAQGPMTP